MDLCIVVAQSESVLAEGSSSAVVKLHVDKSPSGLITQAAANNHMCLHAHAYMLRSTPTNSAQIRHAHARCTDALSDPPVVT